MNLKKISYVLFSIVFTLTLIGCGKESSDVFVFEPTTLTVDDEVRKEVYMDESIAISQPTILVSIQGEVVAPGVFMLREGARIYEAINAAGGFTDNADSESINMVYPLSDGMQIVVPAKNTLTETVASVMTGGLTDSEIATKKVNINTADLDELTTITGIGNKRAMDIIAYRNAGGHFDKIEDIMNVNGIKQSTFDKLKDEICVK